MALELVDAILGNGKEYFGFASNPLQLNSPPVWLPYTVLDRLMMELDVNANDSTYKAVRNALPCVEIVNKSVAVVLSKLGRIRNVIHVGRVLLNLCECCSRLNIYLCCYFQ